MSSNEVTKFLKKVFAHHSTPNIDNWQYPSILCWQNKSVSWPPQHNVYVNYATTYHHSTNSEVEYINKEIVKYLKLLANQEEEWDELLPTKYLVGAESM